ncbi:hypothetical protein [Cardiobacterium hominis]|jgi:hypothetical protein|uniref:hypothetical protein n=1 Tax=Cardiobacterium hominis TaxID=2718 RepID=UPI000A7127D6|nr:hypothetical protein [Cardiobacterium hominis]
MKELTINEVKAVSGAWDVGGSLGGLYGGIAGSLICGPVCGFIGGNIGGEIGSWGYRQAMDPQSPYNRNRSDMYRYIDPARNPFVFPHTIP